MVPPMSSTKLLHIDKPRPVPLCRLVAELSNGVNGVKIVSIADGETPMPVSTTSVKIVYEISYSADIVVMIRMRSMNLIALLTIFEALAENEADRSGHSWE